VERLADVQNPAIKLFITATMSQAQIQTSAQVTTPEKYMNTAAVACNKRLKKTYLHSISHQQETQATYLHSVQYISNWVGYLGGFKKKLFLKFNHFFSSWNLQEKGCDVI
jgi:hypothetical protein